MEEYTRAGRDAGASRHCGSLSAVSTMCPWPSHGGAVFACTIGTIGRTQRPMSITRCACAVMPTEKKDVLHQAQARRGSSVRTCRSVRKVRLRRGGVPSRRGSTCRVRRGRPVRRA
jgi:hypothetical protein